MIHVCSSEVLFRLDPKPLQITIERAQAQLSVARRRIDGLKAICRQQQVERQSAKESADFDQKGFCPQENLGRHRVRSRAIHERGPASRHAPWYGYCRNFILKS
ncbi:hypothetical protein EMIT0P218_360015 [Pseudomonas sp. IT-P218]